jgi:hypothetical protein
MAIADPTALPETDGAAAEYLTEADLAFEREQFDEALTLYWSLATARSFTNDDRWRHIYVRIGTILVGQGNDEEAYRWFEAAGPPGADMLKMLDQRTVDAPVDPDVVPDSTEVLSRYVAAIHAADASGDHATSDALIDRVLESSYTTAGQRSTLCELRARSLIDRGLPADGEAWAQEALAYSSGENAQQIRELIERANRDQGNPSDERFETHGDIMAFALIDFEQRNGDHGKENFEHIVSTATYDDTARGRARYYLGVIAYHGRDFDVARAHFEYAADNAPSPEIGYAAEALEWRYQEEG